MIIGYFLQFAMRSLVKLDHISLIQLYQVKYNLSNIYIYNKLTLHIYIYIDVDVDVDMKQFFNFHR